MNKISISQSRFRDVSDSATVVLDNNEDSRMASFSSTTLNFGEYVYDHLGQRVIKNELGTTVFIYDIFGNLISEYLPDGTLKNDYVYLGGRRLAMIRNEQGGGGSFPGCGYTPPQGGICGINGLGQGVALNYAMMVVCPFLIWAGFRYRKNKAVLACIVIAGLGIIVIMAAQEAKSQQGNQEAVFYYHNDHLGTPQVMTDQSRAIVWDAVYHPFGELENVTSTQNVTNNFRFPGQYEDALTGMYYNHHRYYMPELGRYNRTDPTMNVLKLYKYASNNPMIFYDIEGLCDFDIFHRAPTLCDCDNLHRAATRICTILRERRRRTYDSSSNENSIYERATTRCDNRVPETYVPPNDCFCGYTHEMVHRRYCRAGEMDSYENRISSLALWEIEAYQAQLNCVKAKMDRFHCCERRGRWTASCN